jgi:hypothetical protein
MLGASERNALLFPSSTSREGRDVRNVSLQLLATSQRLLTLVLRQRRL